MDEQPRRQVSNNYIFMNFYNISQLPERTQTAQHFHSSLQQPTLQNVQAQLFVARQRNYELAQSYFQNKYGSGQIYDKYIQNNQLEGLGPPKEQVYDFRRELEKKALEIQQEQTRKIQERNYRKTGQSQNQNQTGAFKLTNKRNTQKKNIWSPQNEQKQPEIYIENEPYEVNLNQQKQSAFMSEFKNYLSNKKKIKEEVQTSKLMPNHSIQNQSIPNQSITSQFKQSGLSQSPHKKKEEKQEEKCYEQELVKKMFRDIAGKTDKSARIEKLQLIEYLNSNKKILKVLAVTPQDVSKTVIDLVCKQGNLLNPTEALIWVFGCLGRTDEVKRLKAEQQFQLVPSGCMLSKELMALFEDTYRMMDRHNDLIIKRVPFISRLTSDPLVKKSLNLPAVFEPQYNRHISLRRIFQRIEIQTLLCSEEEKRINQYISWNQFVNYFQSGHKQRGKYSLIVLIESLKNQQKFGFSHLPEAPSQIISACFKKMDRGEEMFNTLDLINEIKLHKDYEIEKYTFIKQNNDQSNGLSQTFEDVLRRIKETGLKFVTPKEFLQYFSDRGKPIEEFQTDRKNQQSKNFSPTKVSFIENQIFPKTEQPDGYDSDPQIYNNSQLNQQSDMKGSQKEFKRFKQTSQSFIQPDSRTDQLQHSESGPLKVTIPQPFSFEEREKERKMNRSQQKHLPTVPELSQFRAKPIPSKVAEVGLYQKMMTEQQKKNQERKRNSMIMTLANQRPFSFENRKANRKTKQERQQFMFKAKPIPWYCSVELLARKEEEQILRNQRIAKAAQQNLAKAKLPPRMEKDYLQKQAKKALSPTNKPRQSQSVVKVKEPPNFEKIHKEFELALERKRKGKKTTQIKQFNFAVTAKDNSKIKQQPGQFQQFKIKRAEPPPSQSNVDIFAQSTAKFTQQVEKRRKQMQQKRKQEAQKKREQQQRLKIDEQLKRKVQQAAKRNKENKQREQQQKRKQQMAQQQAKFKQWKYECIEKGRQQPLLVDRISKRDQKIQKMKKLWEISQTLKKNGIKDKEHDHYFKREELLMLLDYAQLKDKL